jgi:hypothetical protein
MDSPSGFEYAAGKVSVKRLAAMRKFCWAKCIEPADGMAAEVQGLAVAPGAWPAVRNTVGRSQRGDPPADGFSLVACRPRTSH